MQQDYKFNETTSQDPSVVLFTDAQRKDYKYRSLDPELGAIEYMEQHPEDLIRILEDFLTVQWSRLKVLETYTDSNNYSILQRNPRNDKNKADQRIRHDFGGYISDFHTGYMFGNPVKIEIKGDADEDGSIKKWIDQFNELNDINELNQSLAWDCNTFGRAFEIHWREEHVEHEIEDRVAKSSVFETFVIRDTSIKERVIAAVRCPQFMIGTENHIQITMYTDDFIYEFPLMQSGGFKDLNFNDAIKIENPYGCVNVIEWRNDARRIGSFEKQIPLINAYDANASDTSNYMADFVDAILGIFGDIDLSVLDEEWVENVTENNIGIFKSAVDATGKSNPLEARYLYKEYDVNGKEANSNRLENDIHKFSHTPDLTDEKFGGNVSGVAMSYKLMGVDQVEDKKASMYARAIRERYRLIQCVHRGINEEPLIVADHLNIVFTPNIPRDNLGELKAATEIGAEVSQETIFTHVSCIENAYEEIERARKERGLEDNPLVTYDE